MAAVLWCMLNEKLVAGEYDLGPTCPQHSHIFFVSCRCRYCIRFELYFLQISVTTRWNAVECLIIPGKFLQMSQIICQ